VLCFRRMLKLASQVFGGLRSLGARLEKIQIALGRIEMQQQLAAGKGIGEFQVFSQWGEDGIIAHLVARVPIENRVFVEFGVEDYREANTRFLMMSENWTGLVMDGSQKSIASIQKGELYWRYGLTARAAFITRENINQLIREAEIGGDIGLLSVDIDGNDYWVWQAIEVVQPRIVVVEYNSLFGSDRAVTVPYDKDFVRSKKHHSYLYYGASLAALARLGREKGYALVAGNSAGNNAFFVRKDVLGDLPALTAKQAWRRSNFRESRDAGGELTFLAHRPAIRTIAELPLVDVETGKEVSVGSLGLG
jgi:hypothetical protein